MLELFRKISHHHLVWRGAGVHRRAFDDLDLGYYSLGNGPVPALLIHGIGDRSVHFSGIALALRSQLRMVIPDMPGGGLTALPPGRTFVSAARSREMLHALMAPYADQRPLLIGHSLGGLYAAQMALEAPERYRGVVLINPGGFLLPDSGPNGRKFREFLASGSADAILHRVFHKPAPHLKVVAKGLQQQMRSAVILDFLDAMPASEMITAEQVARLPQDSLLFCGREDYFLPPGTLQGWAAHFPGEVTWLDGSAHASQVECAGLIARRIAERLRTGWAAPVAVAAR